MSHVVSLALSRGRFPWGRLRGPTSWGKENSTPGTSGSQGNLEWLGESVDSPSTSLRAGSAGPQSDFRLGGMAEAMPSHWAYVAGFDCCEKLWEWKRGDFGCSNGSEPCRLSESALFAILSSRFP